MTKHYYILLFTLLVVFSACKKRGKAIWDSDWKAPLIHDSLSLSNLIPDSILTVSSGNYVLDINHSLFEFKLSDFVKLPDTIIDHKFNMALNLNVGPGTSFVNNNKEHVFNMGNGIQLKHIRVKKGGIELKVFNPIQVKTFFTIILPGVSKNGVVLTQNFEANAGSIANPTVTTGFVDLTGYEIDLRGELGTSFNRLQSILQAKTDPNGQAVTVHTSDTILFKFKMTEVALDYARGYFGNQLVSDTVSATIQALNNITDGVLDVNAMTFNLKVENGLKVNGKFKINSLKNINNSGNAVALSHPNIGVWNTINAATGSNGIISPSNMTWNFTPGNSNFENYIENHGAQNQLSFQLQLNPWGNVSGGWDEIYDAFPLRVKLQGAFPLTVGMADLVFQDTFALKFANDPSKTNFKSGQIWINAVNGFPFEGALKLYLLDENYQLVTTISGTSLIESSVFGPVVNGIQQQKSTVFFPVTESDADNIRRVRHCMLQLKLNTYDSNHQQSQVSIPANAFFHFKLGANLTVETHL